MILREEQMRIQTQYFNTFNTFIMGIISNVHSVAAPDGPGGNCEGDFYKMIDTCIHFASASHSTSYYEARIK